MSESQIDRRRFLKQTLGAAGAMALAGCATGSERGTRSFVKLPPPARRGPNEEIRVACVGIHGMGSAHVEAHSRSKGVRVVTLCDVDETLFPSRAAICEQYGKPKPKTEIDVRRVLDDKDVDVVSIATPNHWHALIAVWACQAGKDVYVQKPCSHNISEGRKIVEAARRYNRIVQHGTQSRSSPSVQKAMQLLHEGVIGEVYMARALCFKTRDSIKEPSHRLALNPDGSVPKTFHWDLWQGPAQERPFSTDYVHYNWHWFWPYGDGDIGNQGVHQMDLAMWGLGKQDTHPVAAQSMGGRFTYDDGADTPNTQVATMQYDDGKMLVFEVRGRATNKEWDIRVGNLFYGSKGYMAIRGYGFETVVDGQPGPSSGEEQSNEWDNFHDAVRSGRREDLNAEIAKGHHAATLCHLANIAYRTGRTLSFDPKTEHFVHDREANGYLTRNYRTGFVMPDVV